MSGGGSVSRIKEECNFSLGFGYMWELVGRRDVTDWKSPIPVHHWRC